MAEQTDLIGSLRRVERQIREQFPKRILIMSEADAETLSREFDIIWNGNHGTCGWLEIYTSEHVDGIYELPDPEGL